MRLAPDAPECAGSQGQPCFVLHGSEDGITWVVPPRTAMRIWVLDVDGETVLIATEGGEPQFEAWVSRFDEVISTLEWQAP